MIKSLGWTDVRGAVKGYVNSSVPLHFCHAWQSLSSGQLPPSFNATEPETLDVPRLHINENISLNYPRMVNTVN